ncbi:MAG: hypothetical protein HYX24_01620 [Candidatus Aenigmarchaeota archaeon]|nr:hypothetical protein [Candidatus Aenigmarchaeota archaeon]
MPAAVVYVGLNKNDNQLQYLRDNLGKLGKTEEVNEIFWVVDIPDRIYRSRREKLLFNIGGRHFFRKRIASQVKQIAESPSYTSLMDENQKRARDLNTMLQQARMQAGYRDYEHIAGSPFYIDPNVTEVFVDATEARRFASKALEIEENKIAAWM